ncbi:hypothetical protein [Methylibium sp.]
MTYAEIEQRGDRKREIVARDLPLEDALALVKKLGFGHSAHESR